MGMPTILRDKIYAKALSPSGTSLRLKLTKRKQRRICNLQAAVKL